ncbi:MAG: hypothetical protein LH660_06405, partial [Phormidesmis sp. CAN_BIN36]|nr:hypothetical protein [Phormidesmis sp. CAN_BIN36]
MALSQAGTSLLLRRLLKFIGLKCMARWMGNVIYIDRNPNNPDEGWGWVEVTTEDMKRLGISNQHPTTRRVTKTQEITLTRYKDLIPYTETYTNTY